MTTLKNLEPHQLRVLDEGDELSRRLAALAAFILSPFFLTLDEAERDRLSRQCRAMQDYMNVLTERIAAFKVKPA